MDPLKKSRIGGRIVAAVAAGFVMVCSGGAMGQANCAEWQQVANTGPSARSGAAMVYDSARNVTVLFGGWNGSERFGDTWEWDGSQWSLVAVSGPVPREWHNMAFDSARNVTVLFGGRSGTSPQETFQQDTWEWNGIDWTQVAISGPAGRREHAMAYDEARGVVVLFGGATGFCNMFGDTWEYDGNQWSLASNTGPGSRYQSNGAMVYDSARSVSVLFGGWNCSGYLNDTWEWDGIHWIPMSQTGPSPRSNHGMAFDSTRGVTVLFGGRNGTHSLDDTWERNSSGWTLVPEAGPSPRSKPTLAHDTLRGVTVLFGGGIGNADTWEYGRAAPIAICGTDILVQATSSAGADVILDGTAAHAPDGNPIHLTWHASGVVFDDPHSATPTGQFPVGRTLATLTVADGCGRVATCDTYITVEDATPPEVFITTDQAMLWPPNHKMREVMVVVTTSSECIGPGCAYPLIVQVRSSEADNAAGNSDGNTTGDVAGQDGFAAPVDITNMLTYDPELEAWVALVELRAERDGSGDGRCYGIEVLALENGTNISMASCCVVVPHDRRGGK